jgi:hypothetical protein
MHCGSAQGAQARNATISGERITSMVDEKRSGADPASTAVATKIAHDGIRNEEAAAPDVGRPTRAERTRSLGGERESA